MLFPIIKEKWKLVFPKLSIYSAALGLSASVVDNFIKEGEKTA
jgi:hypothetical protein